MKKNIFLKCGSVSLWEGIVVFSFFLFAFSIVCFSTERYINEGDMFFNMRLAEQVRTQGFGAMQSFEPLPFTEATMLNQFVSYNFFFYKFLTLFTFFDPLMFGAKIYSVLASSFVMWVLYYFLKKQKISYASIWTISLFSFMFLHFINRLLFTRAFTVVIALLLLELLFLQRKKYFTILFLTVFYMYWHLGTFFMPIVVAVSYWLFDTLYNKKMNFKIIAYPLAGTIIALAVGSIFIPGTFEHLKAVVDIINHGTLLRDGTTMKGMELQPLSIYLYFSANYLWTILFFMAICGGFYEYYQYRFLNKIIVNQNFIIMRDTLFFLSFIFFVGMFIAYRNLDFFFYFSATYIAMSFGPILQKGEFFKKNKGFLFGFVFVIILIFSYQCFQSYQSILYGRYRYEDVQSVAKYIPEYIPDGGIIFTPTMDWFPILYHYLPNYKYIIGGDPRALYDYNNKMYNLWFSMSMMGIVCDQQQCDELLEAKKTAFSVEKNKEIWLKKNGKAFEEIFLNVFHTEYILTKKDDLKRQDFQEIIDYNHDLFEKIYTSEENKFVIYKIK